MEKFSINISTIQRSRKKDFSEVLFGDIVNGICLDILIVMLKLCNGGWYHVIKPVLLSSHLLKFVHKALYSSTEHAFQYES